MVHGIAQAVTLLGVRHLRQVLKKAQTGLVLRPASGMDTAQWAQVSVACAKLARNLAGITCLDASVAYTAALLHALGHVLPQQPQTEDPALSALGIWDPRRPRLERKCWGESTHQRSAAWLRQWHLPHDVIAAIEGMEQPMALPLFDPMAGVVHLAVWCQRAKVSGWSERQIADAFPVDVALALGVDVDVVLQQEAVDWSKSVY
jgi:HD-like signal output (HDOD) protein